MRTNDETCERLAANNLHLAWAEFFGRLPWELFVTPTFDPKIRFAVGRQYADRETERWCQLIGWTTRRTVAWLYTVERGRSGRWHSHVLLAGVGGRDLKAAREVWRSRNGIIDVKPVVVVQGAVLYTTKEACRTGDVVFSDTLNRYRNLLHPKPIVALSPEADDTAGPSVGVTA